MLQKNNKSKFKLKPLIEIIGLLGLVFLVFKQWQVIRMSFVSIGDSNIFYVIVALTVYWGAFPLGALSYKMLSERRIVLREMVLAQLAGNGPGRIIPGGLGNVSFSVLYLKNKGFKLQKALVIGFANNLTGIVINTSLFLAILYFRPEIRDLLDSKTNSFSLFIIMLAATSILVTVLWASRLPKFKSYIRKIYLQWRFLIKFLKSNPQRIVCVILIAFLIMAVNTTIIIFCSKSLGVALPKLDALIALSIGVLIGGLLPTPGGLGVVEVGIASTLVVLGYGATEATSIALLYRTITYWQPLLPGTISYLYLRRKALL